MCVVVEHVTEEAKDEDAGVIARGSFGGGMERNCKGEGRRRDG